MGKFVERAKELRLIKDPYYNCFQGVTIPFAEELGYNHEHIHALGRGFGWGHMIGSTCGAIAGGIAVLGMYKKDDKETCKEYYRRVREAHDGMTNCTDLLKANTAKGGNRREHCDGMIFECIEILEDMLGVG